jgi:tetratricopeptide (TPR) repeat protein
MNTGAGFYHLKDFRRAIEYAKKAGALFAEIQDCFNEGANFLNLANAFSALGDTSRSAENYRLALDRARDLGNVRGEANVLYNLSLDVYKTGRTDDAISIAEQSLEIFERLGDPNRSIVKEKLIGWRNAEKQQDNCLIK